MFKALINVVKGVQYSVRGHIRWNEGKTRRKGCWPIFILHRTENYGTPRPMSGSETECYEALTRMLVSHLILRTGILHWLNRPSGSCDWVLKTINCEQYYRCRLIFTSTYDRGHGTWILGHCSIFKQLASSIRKNCAMTLQQQLEPQAKKLNTLSKKDEKH